MLGEKLIQWYDRIAIWVAVLVGLWTIFAGLMDAATNAGVLQPTDSQMRTVWLVSLSILGVGGVAGTVSGYFRKRFASKEDRFYSVINQMLLKVSDTSEVKFQDLGASVFVPKRFPREKAGRPRSLGRIFRLRPSDFPEASTVNWTSHTGMVGECWSSQTYGHKDVSEIAKKYQGSPIEITRRMFDSELPENKQGFDYKEFCQIAGKYSEIVAAPVKNKNSEQIGVLSVDRRYVPSEKFVPALNDQRCLEVIAVAAKLVSGILNPK